MTLQAYDTTNCRAEIERLRAVIALQNQQLEFLEQYEELFQRHALIAICNSSGYIRLLDLTPDQYRAVTAAINPGGWVQSEIGDQPAMATTFKDLTIYCER